MEKKKLEQLKQCELEMLRVFVTVCEQLNLKYYLVEGTLLGAIRHQGFIPWDDDIDVAMPREDYERFLHEAQALLPAYYFVQSLYSEPAYHANFAKIRDCRTTFIESSVKERPINHGVYIDIFPIDYAPQSTFIRKLIKVVDRICMIRISQVFTLPCPLMSPARSVKKNIGRLVSYLCFPRLRHAVIAQKQMYAAFRKGTLVTNYGSAWSDRERMPVEWYGAGTTMTFEGLPVCVPAEYDKWLTQVYGDYMIPPPPEKRVGHHFAEVIDVERPYTDYTQTKDMN